MLCCALELINLTGSVKDGLALYKKTISGAVEAGDNYTMGFKNGESAYVRAWTSDNAKIKNNSPVASNVSTAVLKKKDGKSYAVARAYGFSVNAESEKKENVRELLAYLTNKDVQVKVLHGKKTLPIKKSDYGNPITTYYESYIEEIFPMLDELMFRVNRDDYTYFSRIAREKLSDYIIGEGSLDDAADAVEALLDTP